MSSFLANLAAARSIIRRRADYRDLLGHHGILSSSSLLSPETKGLIATRYAYEERAAIAMAICSMPPNGDYFEFGSEGMGTFRNFLTAFDLNDLPRRLPDVSFYAFDIFGNNSNAEREPSYFNNWKNSEGENKLHKAIRLVDRHSTQRDRCILMPGYFQDTLTDEFTERYKRQGNGIGTLFLDCNIASSYEYVFNWAAPLISSRCFVYMDEYYITSGVRELFLNFCDDTERRHKIKPSFVRSAGGFGALYLLH